ncbi:P-loop containing nucleoside triphosphate hydrolase protein [Mycena galericulata]|nr:P-loop containing nucleoside triphosphate hydrolase protein [Mycena galericulata]
MPRQPTVTETRVNNVIACLKPAIPLLNDVHDAYGTPFVQAILNTSVALIAAIQNVKKNKDECIQLMESVYQVLYGIVNLHIVSETAGSLPPTSLDDLGKFTETIHRIHMFVEAQHDGNRIKSFFRQSEMSTLLKECRAGVKYALEVFKLESGATNLLNIREMQNKADNMHRELLEMISTFSDEGSSDGTSSTHQMFSGSQTSSQSFSMLPAKPKIFHGRDQEVKQIVLMLTQKSPRIAILGPGGMGKTSLAKAALHHPNIATQYGDRFFVPCDSATTSLDIAALIGAHLGLKPGENLVKPVIECLAKKTDCLLILDNLETTWEPLASRPGVEELLSLLTDLPHLALIITMRGAERPAKVGWTRPFLPPLKPLSTEAARDMFMDIADVYELQEIDQILHLTDNMPLAVDLIARLVDYDGCASVLSRWETEKTTFLSKGYDRRSNLDISIRISLSSPRLTSSPGALDLLRLLSILPDGLSDVELLQCRLPIRDVLACKAALLGTSLAFNDDKHRLKSLVPIREHMQYFHPVPSSLVQPLQDHFHKLLNLYRIYRGSLQATSRIDQITLNLGNLHHVLLHGLQAQNSDLSDTINCILSLNNFTRLAGYGPLALMDQIPNLLPQPCNHKLEVEYITEVLNSHLYQSVVDPEVLVSQAISHFHYFNDPIMECELRHYISFIMWF